MNKDNAKIIINKIYELDQIMCSENNFPEILVNHSIGLNIEFLKYYFENFGLPLISIDGKETNSRFLILVQHSRDLEFRNMILAELHKNIDDIYKPAIALITDRNRGFENKKQLYGTQFGIKLIDGIYKAIPAEIEDETNVDIRRAKLGMKPLQEYLNSINLSNFK